MRRAALGVMAAVLAIGIASPARADASYQVVGEADAAGADPRVAALDAAFAAAAREALADLVGSADRRARKADLDREVVARARLWVASFKVKSDTTEGGNRKLVVDVKIATAKLSSKLAELGVAIVPPEGPDAGSPAPGAQVHKATVLLRATTPRGITASYGSTAARDVPGLAPVSAAIRAAGWQLATAPASGPPARQGGELPLDDDSARALAGDAGAEVAVIVGVMASAPGDVRGTRERAVLAQARVRIVDRNGKVLGEGGAVAGARGSGDDVASAAMGTAAANAFAEARPAIGGSGGRPVAGLSAAAGEILVKIASRDRGGAPSWSVIKAIRDRVAGMKGAQATLRRLGGREVYLAVRGIDRADRIGKEIREVERRLTGTTLETRVDGNVVGVRVSGSP